MEIRVPGSPATPGCRSQAEILVPGVTRNSGLSGNRELRLPGVTLKSRKPGSGATELWVTGVRRNFGFSETVGTPGSQSHPQLRVPGDTCNSGLTESSATRVYRSPRNSGLPESRTPGPGSNKERRGPGVTRNAMGPGVTRNSGVTESQEIAVLGFTRKSGIPVSRVAVFPDSPWTGSRSHTKLRIPEVTPKSGFRSHRNCKLPESGGTPSSRSHPELWVIGVIRNSGIPESPWNTCS